MGCTKNYVHREVIKNAKCIYGEILPKVVAERIETEQTHIIRNGYSSDFMLARLVTKYAHDSGQHTCSRGSIGSSLVAFLLGITNVNPLPPHYYCQNCKHTEFLTDNTFYSGYELLEKECPVCRSKLSVDGHNVPYEFFMGLDGDKSPVIKLNIPFSFKNNVLQYINDRLVQESAPTANACSISIEQVGDSKSENPNANICKTDILGFVPLEILSLLKKYTGVSPKDVDINNLEIYKLFADSRSIGIDSDEPATLGIPEFSTKYVRDIIKLTKPSTFGELVKISNLAHGTNVWVKNGECLLKNNICTLKDLPTCSEDVYEYLTFCGLDKHMAFKIAKNVSQDASRKSNLNKEEEIIKAFNIHNIPKWYFDSICKVRDMFPKAHSVEHTKLALIFAWYKIYYPVEFYVAIFNARYSDKKLKFTEKTNEELQIYLDLNGCGLEENDLELFNECIARGITFEKNTNSSKNSAVYSVGERKIFVNY